MIHGIRILAGERRRALSIIPFGRRCLSSRAVMSFGDGSHGAIGLPTSLTGIGGAAYEPTTVPGLPPDVTSVAAGHYHSLAVDLQGCLWAWGRDQEAQLGRGFASPRDSWNVPKRVIGLDLVNVRSASASGVVSAALGDDGSLWIWGKSKRGQLGLGKDVIEAVIPSRVQEVEGERIVKVSFGWGHALALSEDGKLFGWGYYADGRLGNIGRTLKMSPLDSSSYRSTNDQEQPNIQLAERLVLESMEDEKNMPIIWEPHLVEDLTGIEVVDIACGLDHSLVLCRDGTLLSCGSNVYGQLGRVRQDLGLLPVDSSFHVKSVAAFKFRDDFCKTPIFLFEPMAAEGQVIVVRKVEEFDALVKQGIEAGKLIVVDFTASWCPPCRFIAPVFAEMAKAHVNVVFLKVDVDELKEIAQKFDVTAMPTFVFLKGGAEVHRIVGADKVELGKKVLELGAPAATSSA